MTQREWKMCNKPAFKLAEGFTKKHFFVRSQHPAFEIPEPDAYVRLVLTDIQHRARKFIQGKPRQIHCLLRRRPSVGIHRQHWMDWALSL